MALSVFIVEDNQLLLDAVTEALEEAVAVAWLGHATDAPEAIDWLRSHRVGWQLLLVDLFLAQGNGLEVVAACSTRSSAQKVVVFTNYATPDIRRRALEMGADAVFDKSTEIEEMLTFCAQVAEGDPTT